MEEQTNEKCGWQFFVEDNYPLEKLQELIGLAHMYGEKIGPVIMICTEQGYDFLVRNNLDIVYIDFGICENQESVYGMITHLQEFQQIEESCIINNLENSPQNIVTLYKGYTLPKHIEKLVQRAIDKENAIRSI